MPGRQPRLRRVLGGIPPYRLDVEVDAQRRPDDHQSPGQAQVPVDFEGPAGQLGGRGHRHPGTAPGVRAAAEVADLQGYRAGDVPDRQPPGDLPLCRAGLADRLAAIGEVRKALDVEEVGRPQVRVPLLAAGVDARGLDGHVDTGALDRLDDLDHRGELGEPALHAGQREVPGGGPDDRVRRVDHPPAGSGQFGAARAVEQHDTQVGHSARGDGRRVGLRINAGGGHHDGHHPGDLYRYLEAAGTVGVGPAELLSGRAQHGDRGAGYRPPVGGGHHAAQEAARVAAGKGGHPAHPHSGRSSVPDRAGAAPRMTSRTSVRSPVSSIREATGGYPLAISVYPPGGTSANTYSPSAPVRSAATTPPLPSTRATEASGTGRALCAARTVPRSAPLLCSTMSTRVPPLAGTWTVPALGRAPAALATTVYSPALSPVSRYPPPGPAMVEATTSPRRSVSVTVAPAAGPPCWCRIQPSIPPVPASTMSHASVATATVTMTVVDWCPSAVQTSRYVPPVGRCSRKRPSVALRPIPAGLPWKSLTVSVAPLTGRPAGPIT